MCLCKDVEEEGRRRERERERERGREREKRDVDNSLYVSDRDCTNIYKHI